MENVDMHKSKITNSNLSVAALSGADLWNSNLSQSNLKNARLPGSNLSETNLRNVEMEGADLTATNLSSSDCDKINAESASFAKAKVVKSDFTDAVLNNTDLSDANARGATFDDANLEDATFVRTELRDANLRNTRLYQTLFADTRINSNTDFGDTTAYEDPDTDLGENYEDTSRWEAAAWVYRRLQDLHEENAMAEKAREYHVRKEEAHRANYRQKNQYFQWFVYTLNRYLTRHGESLKHVVGWSVVTIIACALAYPFTGGIATGSEVFRFTSLATLSLGLFLRSLYFSTVTFTTLGYGDYHPVGEWSKALAGAESLAGALLVALFVFVLGRRVAR